MFPQEDKSRQSRQFIQSFLTNLIRKQDQHQAFVVFFRICFTQKTKTIIGLPIQILHVRAFNIKIYVIMGEGQYSFVVIPFRLHQAIVPITAKCLHLFPRDPCDTLTGCLMKLFHFRVCFVSQLILKTYKNGL